jgi:hypothetical protein
MIKVSKKTICLNKNSPAYLHNKWYFIQIKTAGGGNQLFDCVAMLYLFVPNNSARHKSAGFFNLSK